MLILLDGIYFYFGVIPCLKPVLIVPSPTECAKFLLDGQIPIVQREGPPLPKMLEIRILLFTIK
jgi:hypothetical protein